MFSSIKTNNCDKNNIAYSIECDFNFFFFVSFFFCFLLVLTLLFICIIYIYFEFGSFGFQTRESQTRWPTSTLAFINPCNRYLFSQKSFITDVRLDSKYASTFTLKSFFSLKYFFYLPSMLLNVIQLTT